MWSGWTNNATIGTILGYVFYWLTVTVALVYMKWKEGRTSLFGYKSAAGRRREVMRAEKLAATAGEDGGSDDKLEKEQSKSDDGAHHGTAPTLLI
jgi:high-affinity iron transporter